MYLDRDETGYWLSLNPDPATGQAVADCESLSLRDLAWQAAKLVAVSGARVPANLEVGEAVYHEADAFMQQFNSGLDFYAQVAAANTRRRGHKPLTGHFTHGGER